jgi:hypothetical protein
MYQYFSNTLALFQLSPSVRAVDTDAPWPKIRGVNNATEGSNRPNILLVMFAFGTEPSAIFALLAS